MNADYHAHTTYSDGYFPESMVGAAAEAGLAGIGLTDHCNVSERPAVQTERHLKGYNLDLTYERRREAIERMRQEVDVEIYDAVELDYKPRDEDAIAEFLETAGFEYAIGSVHEVEGVNVHSTGPFRGRPRAERRAVVDDYFGDLERLIRSELFEIAGHVDIVERNEALRGLATEEHYRRVAAAFADSRTVPEINAGRVTAEYGQFHPREPFLDVLAEYDVRVTVGTDAHRPGQLRERIPLLRERLDDRGLEPVSPFDV